MFHSERTAVVLVALNVFRRVDMSNATFPSFSPPHSSHGSSGGGVGAAAGAVQVPDWAAQYKLEVDELMKKMREDYEELKTSHKNLKTSHQNLETSHKKMEADHSADINNLNQKVNSHETRLFKLESKDIVLSLFQTWRCIDAYNITHKKVKEWGGLIERKKKEPWNVFPPIEKKKDEPWGKFVLRWILHLSDMKEEEAAEKANDIFDKTWRAWELIQKRNEFAHPFAKIGNIEEESRTCANKEMGQLFRRFLAYADDSVYLMHEDDAAGGE